MRKLCKNNSVEVNGFPVSSQPVSSGAAVECWTRIPLLLSANFTGICKQTWIYTHDDSLQLKGHICMAKPDVFILLLRLKLKDVLGLQSGLNTPLS